MPFLALVCFESKSGAIRIALRLVDFPNYSTCSERHIRRLRHPHHRLVTGLLLPRRADRFNLGAVFRRIRIVDDQHLRAQPLRRGLALSLPLSVHIHNAQPIRKPRRHLPVEETPPVRFAHPLFGMIERDPGQSRVWYPPSPWSVRDAPDRLARWALWLQLKAGWVYARKPPAQAPATARKTGDGRAFRLLKSTGRNLFFYFNSTPESHVSFDLTGGWLRIGIVPGRIRIILPVNIQTQIPCLSLPRTCRGRAAGPEELPLQAVFREVDVSLDDLSSVAFGNHFAVPDCFCHDLFRTGIRRISL